MLDIYLLIFKYLFTFLLFIWLHWVSVAHRIFSCGMWTLSYGMWDLVPSAGIEPGSPALGVWSLSHHRSPWYYILHSASANYFNVRKEVGTLNSFCWRNQLIQNCMIAVLFVSLACGAPLCCTKLPHILTYSYSLLLPTKGLLTCMPVWYHFNYHSCAF